MVSAGYVRVPTLKTLRRDEMLAAKDTWKEVASGAALKDPLTRRSAACHLQGTQRSSSISIRVQEQKKHKEKTNGACLHLSLSRQKSMLNKERERGREVACGAGNVGESYADTVDDMFLGL